MQEDRKVSFYSSKFRARVLLDMHLQSWLSSDSGVSPEEGKELALQDLLLPPSTASSPVFTHRVWSLVPHTISHQEEKAEAERLGRVQPESRLR